MTRDSYALRWITKRIKRIASFLTSPPLHVGDPRLDHKPLGEIVAGTLSSARRRSSSRFRSATTVA